MWCITNPHWNDKIFKLTRFCIECRLFYFLFKIDKTGLSNQF